MQPHTAPRAHRTCCVSPRFSQASELPGSHPQCNFSLGSHHSPPRLRRGGNTTKCGQIPPVSHHILHIHANSQSYWTSSPESPSLPPGSVYSTREFHGMCEVCWCPWQNGSPQKSLQYLYRSKWLTTLTGKETFPSQMRRWINATGILSDKYTPHISHFSWLKHLEMINLSKAHAHAISRSKGKWQLKRHLGLKRSACLGLGHFVPPGPSRRPG